ncbi:MAG: hypothetical protein ACRC6V_02245 [Bacteroidales bacterium]
MANFFKGVENLLKHPIDEIKWMADETKGVLKPLLKGDVSESWDSFKGSFGRHNDMMEEITVPLGGRNKLTENPDAAAGAILGSIFAAPAIGGMMGGGGSSGSGFGGFGTEGAFSNYFKPGSITKPGLGSEGVGWGGGANLDLGLPTDYAGMKDMTGAGAESGFDWAGLAKTLQSIKPNNSTPPINMSRSGGGGGRYDKSVFENKLLTREMNSLYNEPLYKPVV